MLMRIRPGRQIPLSQGHVTIDPAKCITCRSCQRTCPTGAISVEVREKTWQIDQMRCIVATAMPGSARNKHGHAVPGGPHGPGRYCQVGLTQLEEQTGRSKYKKDRE